MVRITIAHVASRRRTYDRIQDALAWVLPLYGLSLIIVWFVLVQMGFSLMVWSLQAEPSLLRAFIASGSALSTLGFLAPPRRRDTASFREHVGEAVMQVGSCATTFEYSPYLVSEPFELVQFLEVFRLVRPPVELFDRKVEPDETLGQVAR